MVIVRSSCRSHKIRIVSVVEQNNQNTAKYNLPEDIRIQKVKTWGTEYAKKNTERTRQMERINGNWGEGEFIIIYNMIKHTAARQQRNAAEIFLISWRTMG